MTKFIRVRVPDEVYLKFKIHCFKKGISSPKQLTELVRKFVEIQDQNDNLIGN